MLNTIKKFISLLLIIILNMQTTLVYGQSRGADNYRKLTQAPPLEDFVIKRDAIRSQMETDNRYKQMLDTYARDLHLAEFILDISMKEIEKSAESGNEALFWEHVNAFNGMLISYINKEGNANVQALGAMTLVNQLKENLITAEDAERAYKRFEYVLKTQNKCSGIYCEFLSASAIGLSYSKNKYVVNLGEAVNNTLSEVLYRGSPLAVRKERLSLIKNLAGNDYGSEESNAILTRGLVIAVSILGGIKEVEQLTDKIMHGKEGLFNQNKNHRSYFSPNAQTQIAALDTLSELGTPVLPLLKKYAFNKYSLVSHIHANINLAYVNGLSETETRINKDNLKSYYCNYGRYLSAQEDFELKKKLAYAYGRGLAQSYLTKTGSNECLVIVPLEPDPRKAAKDISDAVGMEIAFMVAFAGFGTAFNVVKNGARILRHINKIKYVANKRNMSLGKFFASGQLSTLPKFKAPSTVTAGARSAQAVAPKAQFVTPQKKVKTDLSSLHPASGQVVKPQKNITVYAERSSSVTENAIKPYEPGSILMQQKVTVNPVSLRPAVPTAQFQHVALKNPINRKYPSGLHDEAGIINKWMDYYRNGYFHPRNQIEAIEGMSPAKVNNLTEYFFHMSMKDAEQAILNPIKTKGRLPDFMYDKTLIPGTKRLPAAYYKKKFNANVEKLVNLADGEGTLVTNNVELAEIITSMKDYTFKQGFSYKNNEAMTHGLKKNWTKMVDEITEKSYRANRERVNELWVRKIEAADGRQVSLRDYFTQKRISVYKEVDKTPEFFLNSPKWVSWENERRNLAAKEYIKNTITPSNPLDKVQDMLVLGNRKNYLSLDEFGDIMITQYRSIPKYDKSYLAWEEMVKTDAFPTTTRIRINCHEGRACQASFGESAGGAVPKNYDGTRMVNRFALESQSNVKAIVFDESFKPRVVTLKNVPYVKDIKEVDIDLVRASNIVADGLDATRDLLTVQKAEMALRKVPDLKATILPQNRIVGQPIPEHLGKGASGYLSLFTRDFYPVKTVYRVRFNGLKPYVKTEYFIRKEIPSFAGMAHRERITFLDQVAERVVK
ncbi:hypothetical protein Emin_0470 [Elusimicrobium minutum Pei191]|uniref:Uncharacterized protein n=1 Tax=Elusimicrobium minutum (strain Pei191) TaxID=445932 RepID=B2KBK5_ELUMP|nr:hypothetical protein [Elusimicrobium minutum]ACC98027.1 hypothetical protein Emin_0470 [Elusimicrobium minutum Pei191]